MQNKIDEKDKIIEDLKAEDKRLNQVIIDKCQEIAILKQDNERQRFVIDQQQDIMILLFRLLEIYNDREEILH